MARVFANVADDELASGISAGATSSTLVDASEFPATGDFSIRFEDASNPDVYEIVTATARATNVLTHAATANAWDAGDKVYQVLAKADLDEFLQETAAAATYQALSVVDAKGDLIVGTADNTTDNLAVGANGSIPVADSGAATGIAWLAPAGASVLTSQTTTSTSFTDLATVGPAVTVNIGASGKAIVIITARIQNNTASAASEVGFAVSGATTRAAGNSEGLLRFTTDAGDELSMSFAVLVSGLNAGSNTFTAKYAVGGGTGTFQRRFITVIPL